MVEEDAPAPATGPRTERREWENLDGYLGLVRQAYGQGPLRPDLVPVQWMRPAYRGPVGLKPFFRLAQREREN